MPVRRTKTIAEKTCREDIGLRPAPALRWYFRPGSRLRTGISGSTLLHKLSETVQDLIWDMLSPSSPNPADSTQQICPKESTPSLFTDKFLVRAMHHAYALTNAFANAYIPLDEYVGLAIGSNDVSTVTTVDFARNGASKPR